MPASLSSIQTLIAEDMQRVDSLVQQHLHSDVPLIENLGRYIISNRGKRLRPTLFLLSTKLFAYTGTQHHLLAAIIEFIHTATLLHDDVVDASLLRRGKATANQCWGNEASVLVGDFVYSRAFQMMVDLGSIRIMRILANATNAIATGEVQQLSISHNPTTDFTECLKVARNKTGKLFEAAAELGAVLGKSSTAEQKDIARYGMHMGVAFQLIDDVLDYSSSSTTLGKNIHDDLSRGNPTIPLLYTMHHSTQQNAESIRKAIKTDHSVSLEGIQNAVRDSGGLEYTKKLAAEEVCTAREALAKLPASAYLDALHALAQFALQRAS